MATVSNLISKIINAGLIINLNHITILQLKKYLIQKKIIIMLWAVFVTSHMYTRFSCIIKNKLSFLEQHKDIKPIKIMQETPNQRVGEHTEYCITSFTFSR